MSINCIFNNLISVTQCSYHRKIFFCLLFLGFLNACKIILQYKPNAILLNQFNNENRTPLHLATINGHGNIVNLLLSHKGFIVTIMYNIFLNNCIDSLHNWNFVYICFISRPTNTSIHISIQGHWNTLLTIALWPYKLTR